jgi:hypothetical protein
MCFLVAYIVHFLLKQKVKFWEYTNYLNQSVKILYGNYNQLNPKLYHFHLVM